MKNKILGYIFLGLIFAGAVGAAYWWQYGQYEYIPNKCREDITGENCGLFNQPKVDETANWKTYRNEQNGFEFKYPAKLKVEDSSSNDAGNGRKWVAQVGYEDRLGSFADIFSYPGKIQAAIDSYYLNNERIKITSNQNLVVDGRQSEIIFWKDIREPQSAGKEYFIQSKGNEVIIVGAQLSNEKLFDQILSTFKFIDIAAKDSEKKFCPLGGFGFTLVEQNEKCPK